MPPGMTVNGWSEERLLTWIRGQEVDGRCVRAPRGHDAAVLRSFRRPVVCVDQTIEGVHVEEGERAAPFASKAVARSLSDLAATAAKPRAVLLALAADAREPERRLKELVRRTRAAARRYGAELVGGDLACRPGPVHLTVTAMGELDDKRTPPGRHRAKPGQVLLTTGAAGGSSLGRHLRIVPRLEEGRWLFSMGARAMMDTSDGLARDAARLASASGVRVDLEEIPIHRDAKRLARASGRSSLDHALHDGEDHELLVTFSAKDAERVLRMGSKRFPGLRRIGRISTGRGVRVPNESGALEPWDGLGGWVHGE